jgi:hypothetical protein
MAPIPLLWVNKLDQLSAEPGSAIERCSCAFGLSGMALAAGACARVFSELSRELESDAAGCAGHYGEPPYPSIPAPHVDD